MYEKFISDIISKNNKDLNERLDRLSVEIKTNSDTLKQLLNKTNGIEKSLTVKWSIVNKRIKIYC